MERDKIIGWVLVNFFVNLVCLIVLNELVAELAPTTLMIGFNFAMLCTFAYMSYRDKNQQDAEINQLIIKEQETHKHLTDRLQSLEQRFEAQKHETTTKERVLKDVTEKARTYKEESVTVRKELSMLKLTAEDQKNALERMAYKLGFFVQMIHDQPAPITLSGADLKNIRFEALRIAIIGFHGLEAFPWRNISGIEPQMYRDFVHASLGEGELDPKRPWAAKMILAAHQSKPTDKSAA
ncbi:MAG: hypothetical protein P1P90_03645 [Patescibacteria group bacterium]|nr:hypothetical protein [Patescibacteria group bacterium]